jgi:hypothetical protein
VNVYVVVVEVVLYPTVTFVAMFALPMKNNFVPSGVTAGRLPDNELIDGLIAMYHNKVPATGFILHTTV